MPVWVVRRPFHPLLTGWGRLLGNRPDIVPYCRTAALGAAVLLAFLFRDHLEIRRPVLLVLGAALALNFVLLWLCVSHRDSLACGLGSSLASVVVWGVLARLTGGMTSPFVLGLWFEVMLAAAALRPAGALGVAGVSVCLLWLPSPLAGAGSAPGRGIAHSGLLLATGLVAIALMEHMRRLRDTEHGRAARLAQQVHGLERELAESLPLRDLGERTARISHRLKNSIHPLRGFSLLLEDSVRTDTAGRTAIEGLQRTIDGMEQLLRGALDGCASSPRARAACDRAAVEAAIHSAMETVSGVHPEVRLAGRWDGGEGRVGVSPPVLEEVLETLFLNAAEAMGGKGRILLTARRHAAGLEIAVEDEGSGLLEPGNLFEPGYTTKSTGSGMGLHLARSLVRRTGGDLATEPADRGARFLLRLPPAEP